MPTVKSSYGHELDRDQVAEWVGQHYRRNFDAEGDRQQEWIDRFLAAHAEQYPTYLVCENWGHIFLGRREEMVRWVYQMGEQSEGVIAAEVQQAGRWIALEQAAREDLTHSLHDNGLPDNHDSDDWDIEQVVDLPDWARANETERGELMPFTVLGSHENTGHFFVLQVEAKDSLQAFGAAAAELLAADQDGDALFYIALPGHLDIEKEGMALPGEGVVSYRTVLEQTDVFGEHAVPADDPAEPTPKA